MSAGVLGALLLLGSAVAQEASRAAAVAEAWLQRMTLEQRAGQLFHAWTLSRADAAEQAKVLRWVREAELGGVILSLGTTEQARAWIRVLQQSSRVPLLVSADLEMSAAYRLDGATQLGNAMLLGATGLPRLAEAAAAATAREAHALGFHWILAPVADVNVNPTNPVIDVRSFGESPALVAQFVAASVRGFEQTGLLSTLKHFPGHGDVGVDSHHALPIVRADRARLERVELAPFRAGIAAGASCVMTGHLAVPALGESPDVPATLSARILGMLRRELGFEGLIVTDALDMRGVVAQLSAEEAAIRALLAGADVLLMPPDPVVARDAVVGAVRAGRVPRARLDGAALAVLRAKERLGLLREDRAVSREGAGDAGFDAEAHGRLADEIAARGVTLAWDRGCLPLPAPPALLVTVRDTELRPGEVELAGLLGAARSIAVHPDSAAAEVAATAEALAQSPWAVVVLDLRARPAAARAGMRARLAPLLAGIPAHARAVVVAFGSPYAIEGLERAAACICAYARTPATVRVVAAVLRGAAPVHGRLPVSIPAGPEAGAGRSRFWSSELRSVAPEVEGMRPSLAAELRARLERAVAARVTPGAVALVSRRGSIVAEVSVGRFDYDPGSPPVTASTPYDLASLTKVCATTPLILRLVADRRLQLDQPVQELLPEFSGGAKAAVTVRHLLAHCGGLPAYRRYFAEDQLSGAQAILAAAMREPLRNEPGSTELYSDVGMMLLMACAERAGGAPFVELVQREVLDPLGMHGARFAAGAGAVPAPPTEHDPWRGRVVRGEVHDENAAAMGGVSGHAGLFGTARDVARVGHAFLGGGAAGWLPSAHVETARAPARIVTGSSRGLGWDTYVEGASGSTSRPSGGFGHTGFTGTSIWCDPATDLCVVLLTNRVHPTRDGDGIAQLRRDIADLAAGALPAIR